MALNGYNSYDRWIVQRANGGAYVRIPKWRWLKDALERFMPRGWYVKFKCGTGRHAIVGPISRYEELA